MDRFKYAEVRQKIIDALKIDLVGPMQEDEVLDESPVFAYLTGMLFPRQLDESTLEALTDVNNDDAFGSEDEDYTPQPDEDDNDSPSSTKFKKQSSIGMSFYMPVSASGFKLRVRYGDYHTTTDDVMKADGSSVKKKTYHREQQEEIVAIDWHGFDGRSKEYPLHIDSNIKVFVTRIKLKNEFSLISVYVINARPQSDDPSSVIFQVEMTAFPAEGEAGFPAERICREIVESDEFYYEQRPIFGRGRGCAVIWKNENNETAKEISTDFIPEYEFAGVSAALEGFDKSFFSLFLFGQASKHDEILERLHTLASTYEKWIEDTLVKDSRMSIPEFAEKIGNDVIQKCKEPLSRICEGIALLESNPQAYDAFCFMNRVMIFQRAIANYSKKNAAGIPCNFKQFLNPNDPANEFGWRPFQIAFILMNISAIVDPLHRDRDIVDLLYFPTGGGKTEAYLGLIAFVIANRRLNCHIDDDYNRDGGVTAILRYTLRLLTTQQRDRLTKMILAAEMVREKESPKYGKEPISIGFWVGGGVTPNHFYEFKPSDDNPSEAESKKRLLRKQILKCPFCGAELVDGRGNAINDDFFEFDLEKREVRIYCVNENCLFHKYKGGKSLPVYLVDEEIYAKCPTVILATVDKFANLPWDVSSNAIFGRVDRKCTVHGYIPIGVKHPVTHDGIKTCSRVKPFAPPELIVQDELHLISGPLGTIYGAYETLIENMCTYKLGEKTIHPKYVVSTATIKNANEQVRCLYGRRAMMQFPANGFEIGDSFFIKEIPVVDDPFRKYVGVCANGQSVITTTLRVYAVILQTVFELSGKPEFKDYVDPYYSLVGYFNSIRELGGTVRLLQDDIPKRINRIFKKYGHNAKRALKRREEITSRVPSSKIAELLNKLEIPYSDPECLDTAIATNMIAVGMDVNRLGLMVVRGQPKQNSEYIQATSRIGRTFPGLVCTIYNPYRPRDLSHYENFCGYHAQLYRYVEGTTATPFSARARDRVLHALIVAAIRLNYKEFASDESANDICAITDDQFNVVKNMILDKLLIVKPSARHDAEGEIDEFISDWKAMAMRKKELHYTGGTTEEKTCLLKRYGAPDIQDGYQTLNSMREVENSAKLYYYSEE